MPGKILVLGATGTIGTSLVSALVAQGEQVKAASRQATPMAGAEAVRFDLADPAGLPVAFDGVDRAFVMVPTGYLQVEALLAPVIAAAAERGVKVVLQTVFGADADDNIPYRKVELSLIATGLPYVIVRPNWFADNFHTFWRAGVLAGTIALPAGDGRSSFVDTRDIAASAAAALTRSDVNGQGFNLTGPEALSYRDAATILSRVLGRSIQYQAISDAAFVAQLTAAGVPADYAAFLAMIFHPVREGWTAPVTDAVQLLTGKAPRSLETYIRDHVAALTV